MNTDISKRTVLQYTFPKMAYSRGLVISLFIHTLFGASNVYQQSALNLLQEFIVPFANQSYFDHYEVALTPQGCSWLWSGLQSAQLVGSIISSFLLTPLMDIFGRRTTVMVISNALLLAGLACQILAKPMNSFELFGCGQVLGGIAVGSYRLLYQFFAESLPTEHRGRATMLVSIAHGLWSKLGIALAFPVIFGTEEKWPWYFSISLFPCLFYFLSAYFVPESPKYLYLQKGEAVKATKAIRYYHGKNVDVGQILRSYDGEIVEKNGKRKSTVSYRTLFVNPVYRRALIISLIANIGVSIQCNAALVQYSNGIMFHLGLTTNEALTIMLLTVIYATVVVFWTVIIGIRRFGRVTLMNASNLLIAAATATLGLQFALKATISHTMAICMIVAWALILTTGIGMGANSISVLLIGEVSPNVAAGKIHQVCTFLSQMTSLLVSLTFLPLMEALGSLLFFSFSGISFACAILFYFIIPETKGKNVSDVIRRSVKVKPMAKISCVALVNEDSVRKDSNT